MRSGFAPLIPMVKIVVPFAFAVLAVASAVASVSAVGTQSYKRMIAWTNLSLPLVSSSP